MEPTNNKVSRASKLPITSINDLKEIGKSFSQAKTFGELNPAQGFIIACNCHQTGMSFNEFSETYHVVSGRISMRADTMLARLLELGGSYQIRERSSERACILVRFGGNEYELAFTAEDAYAEPFAYCGGPLKQAEELRKPFKQRRLKDKYATPRSRMQMLWARVVSDAVRTVCPKACQGYYTPEEVEDFDAPAARANEPVPFVPAEAEPVAEAGAETEFDFCPVAGPLLGQRWADMDLETLQYALEATEIDDTGITPGHREAIERAYNEKKGTN